MRPSIRRYIFPPPTAIFWFWYSCLADLWDTFLFFPPDLRDGVIYRAASSSALWLPVLFLILQVFCRSTVHFTTSFVSRPVPPLCSSSVPNRRPLPSFFSPPHFAVLFTNLSTCTYQLTLSPLCCYYVSPIHQRSSILPSSFFPFSALFANIVLLRRDCHHGFVAVAISPEPFPPHLITGPSGVTGFNVPINCAPVVAFSLLIFLPVYQSSTRPSGA